MDDLIRYDEDVIEGLRRRCDRLRDELEDAMYLLRRVQTGRLSGGRVPAYVDERLTIGARIRGYDVSDCIDAAERALNRECAYLSEFRRQLNKLIRLFEQEEDENVHLLGRIGTGRVLELSRGSGGQARRVVSVVKKKVKKKKTVFEEKYKRHQNYAKINEELNKRARANKKRKGAFYKGKPVYQSITFPGGGGFYMARDYSATEKFETVVDAVKRKKRVMFLKAAGFKRKKAPKDPNEKKTYKRGLHYTAKPVNGVIRSESGSVLYFAETPRNSDHLMTEAEKMRRQQQREMMRTIGTRRR